MVSNSCLLSSVQSIETYIHDPRRLPGDKELSSPEDRILVPPLFQVSKEKLSSLDCLVRISVKSFQNYRRCYLVLSAI